MIKILQFALTPPPYGGISIYVNRLNAYLNSQGVYSRAFNSSMAKGITIKRNLYVFPSHLRSYCGLIALPRLLYLCRSYDIIHTHLSLNTSLIIYFLHKLLRIPVVYTVHNQMIDRECETMNAVDLYFFNLLRKDSKVQFITVNAKSSLRLQETFGVFKNAIKELPAFAPPIEKGDPQDYLSPDLFSFLQEDKPTLLFYAESFAKYQSKEIYGITNAISVFIALKSNIQNLRLIFCMPNPDNKAMESYRTYLNDLGYSKDVYWQLAPIREMWPLLKLCTVLFRPTSTDGDSIMVREALLYGLPVVASDVVSRPQGCIVYPYERQDVAIEKLNKILLHPKRTESIHVSYVKDILDIYSNLVYIEK